ncbi:acyl-CoA N-acyltransferase [Scleroderma yunnanense]
MANQAAATSSTRVSFASLTSQNIGTVRKLHSVLFPIKYSEKYYQDILRPEYERFCQLVYYNDIPVGNICCRLENRDLYLMTMGILAPYRSRQIGSQAIQRIIEAASSHTKPKITRIYLHVQVSNEDAKRFYERHGFKEVDIHENYYKRITPRDAWILEKSIENPDKSL